MPSQLRFYVGNTLKKDGEAIVQNSVDKLTIRKEYNDCVVRVLALSLNNGKG